MLSTFCIYRRACLDLGETFDLVIDEDGKIHIVVLSEITTNFPHTHMIQHPVKLLYS